MPSILDEISPQKGRLSASEVAEFAAENNIDLGGYELSPNFQWRYDEFAHIPNVKFPYFIMAGKKNYIKHPSYQTAWDLNEEMITAKFADGQGNFDPNKCTVFTLASPAANIAVKKPSSKPPKKP